MLTTLIVADQPLLADRAEAALRLGWPMGVFQHETKGSSAAAAVNDDIGLVVLDLGIESRDALDALAVIRRHSAVPILAISEDARGSDREQSLGLGADELVRRSFSPIELLARAKAIVGHHRASSVDDRLPASCDGGGLALDVAARRVRVGDATVRLSRPELILMSCLIAGEGRVVPLRSLTARLWNRDENATAYLRLYVRRLREEIEADPDLPRYLLTERGVGYRLIVPEMGREPPRSATMGSCLVNRLRLA